MAKVRTDRDTSMFTIKKWLGLNENPDGDTELKWGEAAAMRNFRVTKEGSLQIRPGYAEKCILAPDSPVRGLWSGHVGGVLRLLCACGGKVWSMDTAAWTAAELGSVADSPTAFFGFAGNVYILDGTEYFLWTGTGSLAPVAGYIPIVATATPPAGGGTLLESVNKLTGKKRQQFSPDGSATVFQLAETQADSIDRVTVNGTVITTGFTANTAEGKVTFTGAPAAGTNTIEIAWTKGTGDRTKITAMRYSELYNGARDTRVFLYGDGSNQTVYNGLDENGAPSAEYFPDLNVLEAGNGNTPITALIRHFSRLIVFKSDSAYSVQYSTITLDDGTVTAGFYVTPINRAIGHGAPGQIALVENNPWTLFNGAAYEWTPSSAGLTNDERQARRRSDRVSETLGTFRPGACLLFDDNEGQELYIVCGSEALVCNYAADVWYRYESFPASCMASAGGEVYFGTPDGRIMHLSRAYRSDAQGEIDAYWESGSVCFERDWRRKTACDFWVAMKPESQARLTVTVESDRSSDYARRVISSGLSTFTNETFFHWSFGTNRKPQITRVKLKLKKFVYCKLIFSSRSSSAAATVLAADVRLRETGTVK